MNIRLATEKDLHGIMELYYEAADQMIDTPFDCCWRRGGHPSEEFVRQLVEAQNMLVAFVDELLVGAVGIDDDLGHDYRHVNWLVDACDEEVAVIHLLVIRESFRGKGLSRVLLKASLDEAQRQGLRSARLDATANNKPAIALYESEGFKIVGSDEVDVGPVRPAPVPFVVMELPLE